MIPILFHTTSLIILMCNKSNDQLPEIKFMTIKRQKKYKSDV